MNASRKQDTWTKKVSKISMFLVSNFYIRQLIIALGIVIILIISTFYVLNQYTEVGVSLSVPNFHNLTVENATKIADEKELRLKIHDSIYVAGKKPYEIIEQYPVAGSKVKKNRLIFLITNLASPTMAEVPQVTDISFRQATGIIEQKGLKVGDIKYTYSIYNDLVLEQNINNKPILPGSMLPKGSQIDLVVGNSSRHSFVLIPNLAGETYVNVETILDTLSLTKGEMTFDNTITSHRDSLNAIIWKQIPSYQKNKHININDKIDLWFTKNPE